MEIEAVIRQHEDELMSLPNVTGVGIGEKNGKKVLKVYVTHKVPVSALRPEEVIPARLEGWEVDVEESGYVSAQAAADPQPEYP
jgi:hypothetical protein